MKIYIYIYSYICNIFCEGRYELSKPAVKWNIRTYIRTNLWTDKNLVVVQNHILIVNQRKVIFLYLLISFTANLFNLCHFAVAFGLKNMFFKSWSYIIETNREN